MICICIGAPYWYGCNYSRCDSKPESTHHPWIIIIYATLFRARPITAIYANVCFMLHAWSCRSNRTFTGLSRQLLHWNFACLKLSVKPAFTGLIPSVAPLVFRMPEIVGQTGVYKTYSMPHDCGQILILASVNDGILSRVELQR